MPSHILICASSISLSLSVNGVSLLFIYTISCVGSMMCGIPPLFIITLLIDSSITSAFLPLSVIYGLALTPIIGLSIFIT